MGSAIPCLIQNEIQFAMPTNPFLGGRYLAAAFVFACFTNFAQPANSNAMNPDPKDPYKKEWKSIDSLSQKGLYQSALEAVNRLYPRTVQDKQYAQVFKALSYKARLAQTLEEDGQLAAIRELQAEESKVPFPVNAIVQSVLGELLFDYLENHRYTLHGRTTTADARPDDLKTWSMEQLEAESSRYFLASVQHKGLAEVPIQQFDAVTTKPVQTDDLRPSLFDLLAHRAIDHFSNDRAYLTQPAYRFQLEQKEVFANASEFINYEFKTRDTSSFHYRALLLFQQLLRLRTSQADVAAFLDANLKRLRFAQQHSVLPNKDDLYKNALQQHIKAWPRQPLIADYHHALAEWWYEYGQDYNPKTDEDAKKWAWKEALAICDNTIKEHPGTYGAAQCARLRATILTKDLSLQAEQVGIPGKNILLAIAYRNVPRAFVKIVPLKWEDRERFQRWDTAKDLEWLNNIKPVQQLTVELKNPGDYRHHSTEVAFKGVPAGYYAVLISDNDKFRFKENVAGFLTMQVSSLAYLHRNLPEGGAEFWVVDRFSGKPVPGVKAEFFQSSYDWTRRRQDKRKWKDAVSNAEGFLQVDAVGEYQSFEVVLSKGAERLYSDNAYSTYRYFYRREPQIQTRFFLDRAIYRPGQTVYFKGLVVQSDAKGVPAIMPNEKVTITFHDANGQEIAKQELRTNRYGTVHGSFQAPDNGLLGLMRLQSSLNGAQYFRVEEYKRPKFEVIMQPLEGAVALGDKITVKGKAQAYAGSNVDGAAVQYRVVRQAFFPWVPWYWMWRVGYMNQSEMEIANGTTTTDVNGEFSVTFDAIPDRSISRKNQPAFRFTVYADVTDINGETRYGEKSISLSDKALVLGINAPQQIDRSTPPKLTISAANLDGQKVPAQGNVRLERLQTPVRGMVDRLWDAPDMPNLSREEFIKHFPNLPYQEEHRPENLPVETVVRQERFNTAQSEAYALPIADLTPGYYQIVLSSNDAAGQPVEYRHIFVLYDSKARLAPANAIWWADIPNKKLQVGEILHLFAASTSGQAIVLTEFEQDSAPLEKPSVSVPTNWHEYTRFISESDRGGFYIQATSIRLNRVFSVQQLIDVPWSNKELEVEYTTFRDKLLPGQDEEWRIKIKGPKGERVAAEVVAAMYDASLDAFAPHGWNLSLYPTYQSTTMRWNLALFAATQARIHAVEWNKMPKSGVERVYRELQDFSYGVYANGMIRMRKDAASRAPGAPVPLAMMAMDAETNETESYRSRDAVPPSAAVQEQKEEKPAPPPSPSFGVRTNLKETVFFKPDLMTDTEGNVIIRFTMNEALTRWKLLGLAHTTDLQTALFSREVLTQKELMVLPNVPRFVREGDEIEFSAKVSNLSGQALSGVARLELFDALTMRPVDIQLRNTAAVVPFAAEAGQSAALKWTLRIPQGEVSALTYRVTAQAGAYQDGEESAIPVLTNRMLVTETMPMFVRGGQNKTFTFNALRNANSPTLSHQKLTLEFTSNPAWYAVQALPYLMEYPYECIEQVFNRFYANTLATSVANSQPQIRKVFDAWRGTDALQSNLMKNQELKSALLQETPWVLAAQKETEQRQRIALLFDLHRMAQEQKEALDKIAQRQLPSGGFAWFNGGRENWYISQYVAEGLGNLRQLKALDPTASPQAADIAQKAVKHIDEQVARAYEDLEKEVKAGRTKWDDDHLSNIFIHYLYTRSFYPEIPLEKRAEQARNYYMGQAIKYWLRKSIYEQGLVALALHRAGKTAEAKAIVNSLRERALRSEELGMYWKYDRGYFWYQMPIETHALMIAVFVEVAKDDKAVDEMRLWLLRNKHTTHWKTTKATAAAVYALLMSGENWLKDAQPVQVSFDKNTQSAYADRIATAQADAQAGSGYFKAAWDGKEINPALASIKVRNPNKVVTWGAAYWQYFEQLDKIKTFEATPLTIKKELFREEASDKGPVLRSLETTRALQPGDKVVARIEIRVDRDMEYVHLKDMRASGFEPINVLSSHKWQGGLGYYESTTDAATHFFFDYLPKGTYVFSYPLRVSHNGDFSNGITTMQCMYAPEFSSHSEGIRVKVAASGK